MVIKVSQHKLRRYKELEGLVVEYNALKEELMEAALNKPNVQPGPLGLKVKLSKGRRSPKWKDLATKLADTFKIALNVVSGEAWAEAVIEDTVQGAPSKTLDVYDIRESVV